MLNRLTINLNAIQNNYRLLQKKVGPHVNVAAVVKANAYGLGAVQISKALHAAGCSDFYVFTFEEGAELRAHLNNVRVYIISGQPTAEFKRLNLIPVLNTRSNWEGPYVHAVDTGMNRLGFAPDPRLNNDKILYTLSHLACADEPEHPQNEKQLQKFAPLQGKKSFANSSGIFLGPKYHFDQVRPGCALYGINPTPLQKNPMQDVVTFEAKVLQIRDVDRGEAVGYGGLYTMPDKGKLAVISAGYADGFLRSASHQGAVFLNGKKCPVIGRVSMDTVMVKTDEAKEGDWAEIIGPNMPVQDLAQMMKTNEYEIFTHLGVRSERIYAS